MNLSFEELPSEESEELSSEEIDIVCRWASHPCATSYWCEAWCVRSACCKGEICLFLRSPILIARMDRLVFESLGLEGGRVR